MSAERQAESDAHDWQPTTNTLAVFRCTRCEGTAFAPHPLPKSGCAPEMATEGAEQEATCSHRRATYASGCPDCGAGPGFPWLAHAKGAPPSDQTKAAEGATAEPLVRTTWVVTIEHPASETPVLDLAEPSLGSCIISVALPQGRDERGAACRGCAADGRDHLQWCQGDGSQRSVEVDWNAEARAASGVYETPLTGRFLTPREVSDIRAVHHVGSTSDLVALVDQIVRDRLSSPAQQPRVVCPHNPPCRRLESGWPACGEPCIPPEKSGR